MGASGTMRASHDPLGAADEQASAGGDEARERGCVGGGDRRLGIEQHNGRGGRKPRVARQLAHPFDAVARLDASSAA